MSEHRPFSIPLNLAKFQGFVMLGIGVTCYPAALLAHKPFGMRMAFYLLGLLLIACGYGLMRYRRWGLVMFWIMSFCNCVSLFDGKIGIGRLLVFVLWFLLPSLLYIWMYKVIGIVRREILADAQTA